MRHTWSPVDLRDSGLWILACFHVILCLWLKHLITMTTSLSVAHCLIICSMRRNALIDRQGFKAGLIETRRNDRGEIHRHFVPSLLRLPFQTIPRPSPISRGWLVPIVVISPTALQRALIPERDPRRRAYPSRRADPHETCRNTPWPNARSVPTSR